MLAYWNTYGVWNLLANSFASEVADGVSLCTSFWNHGASGVANVFDALLANPVASGVVNCLRAAFWHHLAGGVVDRTLTAFWNHFASGVVNRLALALRNHFTSLVGYRAATWLADSAANGVVNGLASAFWNHLASSIVNGLASALRNHLANGVRNCFSYAALLVTNTVNLFGFAGWNPNLLANRLRWALYALDSACAWAVYAFALRSVPCPATWLADYFTLNRTSNFLGNSIPVSTADLNRLGVVNWSRDALNNFTSPSFLLRNHDCVVNNFAVLLLNWSHDSVVDNALTSFRDRTTNGVVDHLLVCLVNRCVHRVVDNLAVSLMNRCHHGVVDDLAVSFTYGRHNRVVHFLAVCFVHRAANIVGHLLGVCFTNWLHDGVVTSPSLVMRCTNRLVNRSVPCFLLHASDIDYLVFGNRLVLGARALLGLLFVNRATHCFHDGVCCWNFTAAHNASATVLVADRSTVSGVSFSGCSGQ